MKRCLPRFAASRPGPILMLAAIAAAPAFAQGPAQPPREGETTRLANQIRKQILALPNYGVFDSLTFGLAPAQTGYRVVLKGFASRPTLKTSAEQVVKKLEQVESIENRIEVLPLSRQDEDIRTRVYLAIYLNSTLNRYNPNRGSPVYGSLWGWQRARMVGLSNDPPPGFHPISIIVKNGHVTLEGVVDNELDRNVAGVEANAVPGVFAVKNNLVALQKRRARQ